MPTPLRQLAYLCLMDLLVFHQGVLRSSLISDSGQIATEQYYLLSSVQNGLRMLYMLLIDRSLLADTWSEDTIALMGLGLAG